ncbi:D-2-hydroxyacid dehydrogenase family protein, partial [Alphaproteobacteria bacterium]|nr:D-2-hydroxyacid dehydrogenase family protein [Alphaproteobacteria bacterium]
MDKIKVAILDDYQNVTYKFGNWKSLEDKIELSIFNKYIGKDKDLDKKLKDFDVLCLMRERTPLPENLISKLTNLKLVVTSGMWNASIDLEVLKKRDIICCGTDTKANSTAELAWSLIMIAWRRLDTEFQNMKDGNWQTTVGRGLKGHTLGILGLGKQGIQVANFGKAFGMKVIAWSHNLTKEDCDNLNIKYVSSTELFETSDVLTIHTKLSERTEGFIDKEKLKLMKKESVLVNTSRGPIIKEQDLINALSNEVISCAALDVYDIEPLPKNHRLRKMKNIILTPHIGYVSSEAYDKFFNGYIDVINAFLIKKPINI